MVLVDIRTAGNITEIKLNILTSGDINILEFLNNFIEAKFTQ